MREPAFTPGPWALETVKTSCGICHKVGPFPGNAGGKGKTHACVYDDYPRNQWTDELEANARLIAAAPVLYEALSAMDRWLRLKEGDPRALPAMVEAALSLALGESPNA